MGGSTTTYDNGALSWGSGSSYTSTTAYPLWIDGSGSGGGNTITYYNPTMDKTVVVTKQGSPCCKRMGQPVAFLRALRDYQRAVKGETDIFLEFEGEKICCQLAKL